MIWLPISFTISLTSVYSLRWVVPNITVLSEDKKQALSEVQSEIHRLQSEFIKNAQSSGGTVQITPGTFPLLLPLCPLVE